MTAALLAPTPAPSAEDLAFVADALLAIAGPDPRAPFRTEAREEARALQIARRETRLDWVPAHLAARAGDPFLAEEMARVSEGARLTPAQATAFEMRLAGHTFEEIGAARGATKQGARSVYAQALRKVAAAHEGDAYAGLGECYREDCARAGAARR